MALDKGRQKLFKKSRYVICGWPLNHVIAIVLEFGTKINFYKLSFLFQDADDKISFEEFSWLVTNKGLEARLATNLSLDKELI